MGAIGIGPPVADLPAGVHSSTFDGNPLACAAATAVPDIFEQERPALKL
jgi:acetylornithine/succinyldiaminopimelate/putrescine aminotransferase